MPNGTALLCRKFIYIVPSKVSARSTPTGAAATKSSKATTISVAASTTATASSTAAHQISQKEED